MPACQLLDRNAAAPTPPLLECAGVLVSRPARQVLPTNILIDHDSQTGWHRKTPGRIGVRSDASSIQPTARLASCPTSRRNSESEQHRLQHGWGSCRVQCHRQSVGPMQVSRFAEVAQVDHTTPPQDSIDTWPSRNGVRGSLERTQADGNVDDAGESGASLVSVRAVLVVCQLFRCIWTICGR